MDRPEDVDVNLVSGKVYVVLTNNAKRKADQVDAANPRAENKFGHIIEITPAGGDHTAPTFTWEILLRCGDPSIAEVGAAFNPATSKDGWFGMPDNVALDLHGTAVGGHGRKHSLAHRTRRRHLGAWRRKGPAAPRRAVSSRCRAGAEMCALPHAGSRDVLRRRAASRARPTADDPNAEPAHFDAPSTRWPNFKDGVPPRPSIVAITRKGGGKIAV